MDNNKRKLQDMFGIEIFEWDGWDEIDIGYLNFYNVKFLLDSMKIYDGRNVSLNMSGLLEVYSEDGTKTLWSEYLNTIPEFKERC